MKATIAIIGAGDLGGALAHTLACRDRVAEIRLIDQAASIAAGKALDIQQSAPIDGFRSRIVAARDADGAPLADADVVVLADAVGPPAQEWRDDPGTTLLKRIAAQSGRAVIICAGALQRRLIERAVSELGISTRRIIGSAPIAWAGAIRARVALELDASPRDVSLLALGNPPEGGVIGWTTATVGGASIAALMTPPQLRRMDALSRALWPPGPYALASAAVHTIEAITCGRRSSLCCFVGLDGQFGVRGGVTALPVILDGAGVERVLEPELSSQEKVRLENTLWRQKPPA